MEPILRRLASHQINLEYIADYLLVAGSTSELATENCAYAGVRRLLPGSMLHWTQSTGDTHTHRYWNWLERLTRPWY